MEKLREKRIKLGMSQYELSKRSGVNAFEISKFENGRGNPTLKTLEKLCEALDMDLIFAEKWKC